MSLRRVRVAEITLPELAWAEGLRVSLPGRLLAGRVRGDDAIRVDEGLRAAALELARDAVAAVRLHAAWTGHPPLSGRLPFSYQRLPPALRMLYAHALGRIQRWRQARWAAFPGWPLDLSADFLADLLGGPGAHLRPTPVVLSHDIDSPEGLHNLMKDFLPLEERFGARSTNFVVPRAWPLDHGALGELAARGHEIGQHGYDHANRTAFLAPEALAARLDATGDFVRRHRVSGYRAPSLLRTPALLAALAHRYAYDSSIPTSGGPFPLPNNGCASARPFIVEGILEIPLSLPRDGTLRFLGHGARRIARMWIETADIIARSGGVVVLLTHCERRFSGNPAMLGAYARFLEHVAAHPERFRFLRARDLQAAGDAGAGAHAS